uniref:Calsequestrin n=1 Tax=Amblyomma parvum TaxID=251391 RepID=A0A023G0K8_AMBPA
MRTALCVLAASVAVLWCSTARVAAAADLLGLLDVPVHDGIIRVCRLESSQALVQAAAETSGTTLVVRVSSDAGARKQPCGAEDAFETAAQLLEGENVKFCEVPESVVKESVPTATVDSWFLFRQGRALPYHGRRTTSALLSWVQKASQPSVSVITGKVDKTAFDQVHELKLVGFFVNGAADYKLFEEASITEGHHARFYAVFDRNVAKHLKLDTVGQIALYSPFVKQPVICPQNPASLQDIRAFIAQHKHVGLTKVDEHNIRNPELLDPSRVTVLAVADQNSPMGAYFLRLLHRALRNITNATTTTAAAGTSPHINLLWVDPTVLPTAHAMLKRLGQTGPGPHLGTHDSLTGQGQWFDMSKLNFSSGRGADEENARQILAWIVSLATTATAHGTSGTGASGTWRFSEVPASQIGAEGGSLELRCTVLDAAAGDCLWLREGRNIGTSLSRLPHLSWAGAGRNGDCSLVVRGLTRGRDDGSWVCQVTGDALHSTLTSPPAVIVISSGAANAKTEL